MPMEYGSHTTMHPQLTDTNRHSEEKNCQHRQTEIIMEAHKQMITALFLTTPEIPKFRGEPLFRVHYLY